MCVQVFEAIKLDTPLVMDFIQFGGLDLLEKAMRTHSKDDFISVTVPRLLKVLLSELLTVLKSVFAVLLTCLSSNRCQRVDPRSAERRFESPAVSKMPGEH